MNGGQDMGGTHGFGPVDAGAERAGVSRRMGEARLRAHARHGHAGRLEHRHVALRAREPAAGRISGDELLPDLVRRAGKDDARSAASSRDDEIDAGHSLHPPKPVKRTLSPGDVAKVLYRGGPTERETNSAATFKAGDRVRAKNINPPTHTRLPRYVRGHVGVIERVIGCHVFPDSNALGAGENPQWLYTVRFDGRELWGADGDPTVTVSVDAWEPYLEPA